jgi:hypothetical protein
MPSVLISDLLAPHAITALLQFRSRTFIRTYSYRPPYTQTKRTI